MIVKFKKSFLDVGLATTRERLETDHQISVRTNASQ